MKSRLTDRTTGMAALVTAVLLTASVVLFHGGPRSPHGGTVLAWFADNATAVRTSTLLGFAAMIAFAGFAVAFRESTWVIVADRPWTTVIVLQSAVVSGVLATIAAGLAWSIADLAGSGMDPAEATVLWTVSRNLFRFAAWGLSIPLLAAGAVLYRHCVAGQFATVLGGFVIGLLLIPATFTVGLYAFAGWCALVGLAFSIRPTTAPEPVAVRPSGVS